MPPAAEPVEDFAYADPDDGFMDTMDFTPAQPVVEEPPSRPRGRRGRRAEQEPEFQLDSPPDSKSFDLDYFDIPPDFDDAPPQEPKGNPFVRLRDVVVDGKAGKFLIPVAVIIGAIAAFRVGTIVWQISPFLLGIPVLVALALFGRRWLLRAKVTKWFNELRDAVDERGLLAEAVWYGPAVSLPAPDEPDRPLWNGILVVYRKGVAWFPTEDAASKKALWWKKKFSDVALVHRSSGSNGVGMDVHLHGGDVKCHQIPPGGFADGAVEALTDCMYPVLDD